MTIPEEIERLKLKLAQTAGEQEQAEILIEILTKYEVVASAESQPYVDQLLALAEKLSEPRYKAWGLYHFATIKLIKVEYDVSMDLCNQALPVFDKLKEVKGVSLCYHNIGECRFKQGNYAEALKNYFASLKLREEIGDKSGIANSYHNIGVVYFSQGNYPESLKHYFASLKLREEIGEKSGIANSWNNIAVVYFEQGNYPGALKNYFASLKLREEIGYKSGISESYNNIGLVYNYQGNYSEALKFFFAALKLGEETGEKFGIANLYNSIGAVHYYLGNYSETLKNFFASLKLMKEIGEKFGIANSYNSIGCVYEKQGNYPEALNNHFASLELNEETGDKRGIAQSYKNIGIVYEKQGNYSFALKNLFAALKLAEEIDAQDIIKQSSLGLSNTYKAAHDFENALKYHEKYHLIDSEMLGEESQKQLTNLSFTHNLEQKEKDLEIEQLRNVELKKERDRSESLLLNILPGEVAEELKEKGTASAKLFDEVTVLFTDFKSFTNVSERLSPQQLVDELHACFSAFDEICGKYNIEKIKTVGDAYLAVSGLPLSNPNHAHDLLKAAIEIRDFMLKRKLETRNPKLETFEIRIGAHSGSVVAGIVGVKKFAYDIWGDTVNTAARMEQNSEAGKINISQTTYELVKDKFTCNYRGEIEAKNKGKLKMYFVEVD